MQKEKNHNTKSLAFVDCIYTLNIILTMLFCDLINVIFCWSKWKKSFIIGPNLLKLYMLHSLYFWSARKNNA